MRKNFYSQIKQQTPFHIMADKNYKNIKKHKSVKKTLFLLKTQYIKLRRGTVIFYSNLESASQN
jgi:hypothetical protein